MQAALAGHAVVLASVASALVNLPIIRRNAKNPSVVATIGDLYGRTKHGWHRFPRSRAISLAFQKVSHISGQAGDLGRQINLDAYRRKSPGCAGFSYGEMTSSRGRGGRKSCWMIHPAIRSNSSRPRVNEGSASL